MHRPARTPGWLALLAGLTLLVFSLAPAPSMALQRSGSCPAISEAQVAELFERWNAALASGDSQQVGALYSRDALLLPTLSATPRSSPEAIEAYFASFLAQQPRGRIDSRRIELGCDLAIDAGTYSFQLQRQGPEWVTARYTFVYGYRDGRWLIVHHHSSLQPPS